ESEYKHGRQNGMHREYDSKGRLVAESTYAEDEPHGTSKEFYENGALHSLDTYTNGQLINSTVNQDLTPAR
ncbi:MAG: hypothetical protein WCQ99_04910, partial [Pseudomonadota bacterium]